MILTPEEALRFVSFIRLDPSGCWLWTGGLTQANKKTGEPGGYPKFHLTGRTVLAHRVMFMAVHGYAPPTVDHLCRRRACVRRACLEGVTHRENVLRSPISRAAINARKTHCIHGHPFTPENSLPQPGGKECRTCRAAIYKRYRQRAGQ